MAKSHDIRSRSGAGGSTGPSKPSGLFPHGAGTSLPKPAKSTTPPKKTTPKSQRGGAGGGPPPSGGGKITSVRPKV